MDPGVQSSPELTPLETGCLRKPPLALVLLSCCHHGASASKCPPFTDSSLTHSHSLSLSLS